MSIITISRGTMSGGKQLAESLAERLGDRCVSREIIVKAAGEYGVPEDKLMEAIGKSPSIFQKLTFERERYLAYIQAILCEYAVDDDMIYHGNAGHFLLPGVSHVLRVRILAEMPFRIESAMNQFGFTEKKAIKYIKEVDKERDRRSFTTWCSISAGPISISSASRWSMLSNSRSSRPILNRSRP